MARGVSLIEAMAAAGVLGIGILGSFSGMVLASRQNSSAARIGRADAAAQAVRAGLELKSYAALSASTGPFAATNCTSNAAVLALTHGLSGASPAPDCVIDLDAFDTAASAVNRIVPNYGANDRLIMRRILVVWNTPNAGPIEFRSVGVIVSFNDGLGRRFIQQFVGISNPAINRVGVEI
jgi:hypothetical protein